MSNNTQPTSGADLWDRLGNNVLENIYYSGISSRENEPADIAMELIRSRNPGIKVDVDLRNHFGEDYTFLERAITNA